MQAVVKAQQRPKPNSFPGRIINERKTSREKDTIQIASVLARVRNQCNKNVKEPLTRKVHTMELFAMRTFPCQVE
jgi:hypothetical protein